jgi:hypothetical protein
MPAPLPVYTDLMARTAEMLALPHLVCRRRDCRRRNSCYWHFSESGEPCCLRNLTVGQRRLFDELYEQAIQICKHGGYSGLMYNWGGAVQRALQDAGVEIARTVVPAPDKRRFDAFRRDRERIDPPGAASNGSPR